MFFMKKYFFHPKGLTPQNFENFENLEIENFLSPAWDEKNENENPKKSYEILRNPRNPMKSYEIQKILRNPTKSY